MLMPVDICTKLTTDEFIGLCIQLSGKFDVIDIERDEHLDPTVIVQLRTTKECKVVKVQPWQISN